MLFYCGVEGPTQFFFNIMRISYGWLSNSPVWQSIQQDLHNALGFRSLIGSQGKCKYWHKPTYQCAFSHCFATEVTATTIAVSFIPNSPLHFITFSAIPPCLCDTFFEELAHNLFLKLSVEVVQYIPRNMHTVFALLCFVVVIHWLIFPYPSGLLHWHCGNLTIAPVPAKQPWWIWINTSCEFIMNDCITTTKQSTTKPCAYFLGYTVCPG